MEENIFIVTKRLNNNINLVEFLKKQKKLLAELCFGKIIDYRLLHGNALIAILADRQYSRQTMQKGLLKIKYTSCYSIKL